MHTNGVEGAAHGQFKRYVAANGTVARSADTFNNAMYWVQLRLNLTMRTNSHQLFVCCLSIEESFSFSNQSAQRPEDFEDYSDAYLADWVVDSRTGADGEVEYLLKWHGCTYSTCTWTTPDNVGDDLIELWVGTGPEERARRKKCYNSGITRVKLSSRKVLMTKFNLKNQCGNDRAIKSGKAVWKGGYVFRKRYHEAPCAKLTGEVTSAADDTIRYKCTVTFNMAQTGVIGQSCNCAYCLHPWCKHVIGVIWPFLSEA